MAIVLEHLFNTGERRAIINAINNLIARSLVLLGEGGGSRSQNRYFKCTFCGAVYVKRWSSFSHIFNNTMLERNKPRMCK